VIDVTVELPEFVKACTGVAEGRLDIVMLIPTAAFAASEADLLYAALKYANDHNVPVMCVAAGR
jgi:hypothetical protein